MKKLCKQCQKEFEAVRSDAKFCSPSCKAIFNRDNKDKPYILTGNTLYGRNEVMFRDEQGGITNSLGAFFRTRPEPENETDIPSKDDKCGYTRENGTYYLIDAVGKICDKM